jgi:chromosome segregation ATPase
MTLKEKARAIASELKDFVPTPGQSWDGRATELIERMAAENNADLLTLYKKRGAEIDDLTGQRDTARAELHQLQSALDVANRAESAHREWRKAANRRVRDLEEQITNAAASGDETMTKRERFAAAALQGLCANGLFQASLGTVLNNDGPQIRATTAATAVALGDATIEALAAETKQ